MKTSLVANTLARYVPRSFAALLVGAPGVGKSDLAEQAAHACNADFIVSHPVVADPTDVKGLPWPDVARDVAKFLPFGDLARAMRATKRTVWLLDDLGQAPPAVQAAFMQLLLARRVNEHVIPDCVSFIAATNRRSDRAGVSGILEPVKSRFVSIIRVEPDFDDWCTWAFANDVPVEVISFLRFRDEFFHDFKPSAEMTNSPSPRTWNHVGKILRSGPPPETEKEEYEGAVGEAAATEFTGFLRMYRSLPNLDAILLDPDQGRIPDLPAALYATCTGLATRASPQNFARIAQYANRLHSAGKGEFAALLVRDCYRREPEVQATPAFVKIASGELGKLWVA